MAQRALILSGYVNLTALPISPTVSPFACTPTIKVYYEGQQIASYTLAAGAAKRKNYPATDGGPLQVVSSEQPILSTIRMLYKRNGYSSLYEMTGLPGSQLSTRYFFPWYNNAAMKSELRFAVP